MVIKISKFWMGLLFGSFFLTGCTSDVEKCVEVGLKQDHLYNLSKEARDKAAEEYRIRLSCLHGR
jgi:hypothetical protein